MNEETVIHVLEHHGKETPEIRGTDTRADDTVLLDLEGGEGLTENQIDKLEEYGFEFAGVKDYPGTEGSDGIIRIWWKPCVAKEELLTVKNALAASEESLTVGQLTKITGLPRDDLDKLLNVLKLKGEVMVSETVGKAEKYSVVTE